MLDELDFNFSLIAITETRISNGNEINYESNIQGYAFEFVPTPLSAGGVGMYINEKLAYTVIEKTSEKAFQALWIEILVPNRKNIICGVLYRQHNSPESFLTYLDDTFERLSSSGKPIYIIGDFNIDLLKAESCNYAHNFLLSLQSYSFMPLIDKPTRVYSNSATLIDNILSNNLTDLQLSGNIISDISDHFSQFCIMLTDPYKESLNVKNKFRDYTCFSEVKFLADLSNIKWMETLSATNSNVDKLFSTFYNKLNQVVNTHAPFKPVSKRKLRRLSKPWITKGIRTSIKIKNRLFHSDDKDSYRRYRNKITTLIRASKKTVLLPLFSIQHL